MRDKVIQWEVAVLSQLCLPRRRESWGKSGFFASNYLISTFFSLINFVTMLIHENYDCLHNCNWRSLPQMLCFAYESIPERPFTTPLMQYHWLVTSLVGAIPPFPISHEMFMWWTAVCNYNQCMILHLFAAQRPTEKRSWTVVQAFKKGALPSSTLY